MNLLRIPMNNWPVAFWSLSEEEILQKLSSSSLGLTEAEASHRHKKRREKLDRRSTQVYLLNLSRTIQQSDHSLAVRVRRTVLFLGRQDERRHHSYHPGVKWASELLAGAECSRCCRQVTQHNQDNCNGDARRPQKRPSRLTWLYQVMLCCCGLDHFARETAGFSSPTSSPSMNPP